MKTLKKITLVIFLLGSVMGLQAQELKLFKAENGNWGYKDNTGKVIIEPKFKNAKEFGTYKYAIADGSIINKMGKTILTVDEIKEKNKLNEHVDLISEAGNEEYWINQRGEINSNGEHTKIDTTGKVISEWRKGSVNNIQYFNDSGFFYKDPERLVVCEYNFNLIGDKFDIYYQIIGINGDTISEKYTYLIQQCDGYALSNEKWNAYDTKTGSKLSKKYSNLAKNYKKVSYFDFSGKCFKVDRDFKFVKDLPDYFMDGNVPNITFGINIESNNIESLRTSLDIGSSIRCTEILFPK